MTDETVVVTLTIDQAATIAAWAFHYADTAVFELMRSAVVNR